MKDEEDDNTGSEEQNTGITVKVSEDQSPSGDSWFSTETKEEETKTETEEEKSIEEEKKETTEEKAETKEEEKVPAIIDETAVFNFLKEKGITATNLEDLKPKEVKQLTPEVEKYLEFKEKTGNSSFTDFLETQKDWSQEPKQVVLMQNLKSENPTLNEKQLERLYNREYAFDEDIDDEDVVMDKEINIERDYQKGLKALEDRKQQYEVPRGSDESVPEEYRNAKATMDNFVKQQEEDDKLFADNRNDYIAKTEQVFTDNFEGFKIKVGNEKTGFEDLIVKPENIQETRTAQSDLSNFNNKYFDEKTGAVKDAEGLHKAIYFGMNADKIAEHFYNLGKAKAVEDDDKLSKNIQNDNVRKVPEGNASKITVRKVEP